jgi:hypothetical protein
MGCRSRSIGCATRSRPADPPWARGRPARGSGIPAGLEVHQRTVAWSWVASPDSRAKVAQRRTWLNSSGYSDPAAQSSSPRSSATREATSAHSNLRQCRPHRPRPHRAARASAHRSRWRAGCVDPSPRPSLRGRKFWGEPSVPGGWTTVGCCPSAVWWTNMRTIVSSFRRSTEDGRSTLPSAVGDR